MRKSFALISGFSFAFNRGSGFWLPVFLFPVVTDPLQEGTLLSGCASYLGGLLDPSKHITNQCSICITVLRTVCTVFDLLIYSVL